MSERDDAYDTWVRGLEGGEVSIHFHFLCQDISAPTPDEIKDATKAAFEAGWDARQETHVCEAPCPCCAPGPS